MSFLIGTLLYVFPAEPLSAVAAAELIQVALKTIQNAQAQAQQNAASMQQIQETLNELNGRMKRIEDAVGVSKPSDPAVVNRIIDGMKIDAPNGFRSTRK